MKAVKEGYVIKPVAGSDTNFEAQKLASVVVKITSTTGEPVSAVLVALSNADGYRRNEQTNDKGMGFARCLLLMC